MIFAFSVLIIRILGWKSRLLRVMPLRFRPLAVGGGARGFCLYFAATVLFLSSAGDRCVFTQSDVAIFIYLNTVIYQN